MITIHARDRYNSRIKPYTSKNISMIRLEGLTKLYPRGKHYVRIANLPRTITTPDGSTGNSIVAIINDGDIVTIMLSDDGQRWHDGTFRVRLIG